MRFGLAIPHYDNSLRGGRVSWQDVKRIALLAESNGFDSLWVSDHFFLDWAKYGGPEEPSGSLECWTTMSSLAAVTGKIRIGSLTLCNDFRNPALVAKMAASLDLLSGGRVDVGLGAGWYEREYRATGIAFDSAGTRIRRLGEAAEIVGRLLAGEEVTFKGDFYTIDGALCRPRPLQRPRPPVWIGGKGDRLLRTVARVADGWNMSWLGPVEAYRDRVSVATKACEEVSRDPSTLARSVGVYLLAGRNDEDLERRFARLAERTPAGILKADKAAGGVSLEGFRRDRFVGTVDEIVDRLGELKELGVDEVIVTLGAMPFQVSDEEEIELVGAEIAPALR